MSSRPTVDDVLRRFSILMDNVAGMHTREFLGVDLTMPQAKVLYIVSVRSSTSMSGLAAELQVGPSAVSGLVDRLVAHGYLDRQEDPTDRRQQLVSLTDHGRDALDRMRELRAETMRRLLAGFSPAELSAIDTTLSALDREVKRSEPIPNPAHGHERTPA